MNPKLLKILAIIGGIVLLWLLVLLVRGESRDQPVVTLEFWNVFDKSDTLEPLLEDFTAQTGVKVNYRSFTDLKEYRETLLLELAAGEGPDVLAIHNSWIPKYGSLLQPLPSQDLGYTQNNVKSDFVDAVSEAVVFEEKIPESDVKKGRMAEQRIFALPMYLETLGLYFNKTIFRNVLSKPYPAPELTWSGVLDDVIEITALDNNDPEGFRLAGIALGRTDNISRGLDIFYNLYHQLGGADLQQASKETVRNASGQAYKPLESALDFFTTFSRNTRNQEYSWNNRLAAGAPEKEIDAFVRGKVAMVAGYSYYYEQIKDLIQQYEKGGLPGVIQIPDIEIAPLPQVQDPTQGNPKVVLADFFALAVAKSSAEPHAAWQLILKLTGRAAQQQYHAATGKPTSRRDLITEQKQDPLTGIFAEQAVYADILPISDDQAFAEIIAEAVTAVADGEMSVGSAVSEMVKALEGLNKVE
ncbi:MAG: extracellular solute-binding protein [Patescibacteria group bacterium]